MQVHDECNTALAYCHEHKCGAKKAIRVLKLTLVKRGSLQNYVRGNMLLIGPYNQLEGQTSARNSQRNYHHCRYMHHCGGSLHWEVTYPLRLTSWYDQFWLILTTEAIRAPTKKAANQ